MTNPNDLAAELDADATEVEDGFDLTLDSRLAARLRAAAALLRQQAEQLRTSGCESQGDEGRYWEVVAERDEARRRLDTLRNAIGEQVRELRAVHRPQWAGARGYTTEPRDGYLPVGCVECYPHDGSWPCITAEVADALAAAGDGVPKEGATDGD